MLKKMRNAYRFVAEEAENKIRRRITGCRRESNNTINLRKCCRRRKTGLICHMIRSNFGILLRWKLNNDVP